MSDLPGAGSGPLEPSDLDLLAGLRRGNDWTRSLLCTLGRRGTWLRQRQPERAAALLDALVAWPWYKAGQFLFDLFEWEDFMVDGPPPPPFVGDVDAALGRLAQLVRSSALQLDGTLPTWGSGDVVDDSGAPPTTAVPVAELPPLEPGLHLYQDVVLGVLLAFSDGHAR